MPAAPTFPHGIVVGVGTNRDGSDCRECRRVRTGDCGRHHGRRHGSLRPLAVLSAPSAIDRAAHIAAALGPPAAWLEDAEHGNPRYVIARFSKLRQRTVTLPSKHALALERQVRAVGSVVDTEVERRLRQAGLSAPYEASARRASAEAVTDAAAALVRRHEDRALRSVLIEAFGSLPFPDLTAEQRSNAERMVVNRPSLAHRKAYDAYLGAVSDERAAFRSERAAWSDVLPEYRFVLHSALSELRPFGAGDEGWNLGQVNAGEWATAALARASDAYPSDWVTAANRAGPIHLTEDERGFAATRKDGSCVIGMSSATDAPGDTPGTATAVHEVAHRMESALPHIKRVEWAFYHRRTHDRGDVRRGQRRPPIRMTSVSGSYRDDEVAREGGFPYAYVGIDYGSEPSSHYEVLSVGAEMLWCEPAALRRDRELRELVVGLIAAG